MFIHLYLIIMKIATPIWWLVLKIRVRKGLEHPGRYTERQGIPSHKRPHTKRLIWVHGASIGEIQMAVPLIRFIQQQEPHTPFLITTCDYKSAELAAKWLPDVIHQYIPLDAPRYVDRFLTHWQPTIGLWIESELWPVLLHKAQKKSVFLAFVSGRLSQRSYKKWRYAKGLISHMLNSFAVVLAQSHRYQQHFTKLGGKRVDYLGNLKYACAPLHHNAAEVAAIRNKCPHKFIWVCASLHPYETTLCLKALQKIHQIHGPDSVLCILIPRHLRTVPFMTQALDEHKLSYTLRDTGDKTYNPPHPNHPVYIANTFGEIGTFYTLAHGVFVGGSFDEPDQKRPHGGHNPLEPARLNCALCMGPSIDNCRPLVTDLIDKGALTPLNNETDLTNCIDSWITNPSTCANAAAAGLGLCGQQAAFLKKTYALLKKYGWPDIK
jgi:3-deoxy-D-manno-octulosonic-acid transferase